jgi:hypothetical protein
MATYTDSGNDYAPGESNGRAVASPPELGSIDPTTAPSGSPPPTTLHAYGYDFAPDAVIAFAGVDQATTRVDATHLTADLDLSSVGAGDVDVTVHDSAASSRPRTFSVTA